MKREWLLSIASSIVALLTSLALLWSFAPRLLGLPADLQLVQMDTKVPPFYEGVFRREDLTSKTFIVKDPRTRVRARPFFPALGVTGPTDILGFRNNGVPNIADVVVIGDSQTYGNNVFLPYNWPNQMVRHLARKDTVVYSMAVGGWGAVQYLDMFTNATVLQPRIVIVAFYTGNDPLESFTLAYGSDQWAYLRPDHGLSSADAPKVRFPAPESEWWEVLFSSGVKTIFTPRLRLVANEDHPAVRAGYEIMAEVAMRIGQMAESLPVKPVFTIIPTKELVYVHKVASDGIEAPEEYKTLVSREQANIKWLEDRIAEIPNTTYVNVIAPLQATAKGNIVLYPEDINGHPITGGYEVIGRTIANAIGDDVPAIPNGLVSVDLGNSEVEVMLVSEEGARIVQNPESVETEGWSLEKLPKVQPRDVAKLPLIGIARIGPPQ